MKALSSQFSYTDVMMNMKLLAVLTPLFIYLNCSTKKMFWEERFIGDEKLFSDVNMKKVVIVLFENTGRSRLVKSMPPWTSH